MNKKEKFLIITLIFISTICGCKNTIYPLGSEVTSDMEKAEGIIIGVEISTHVEDISNVANTYYVKFVVNDIEFCQKMHKSFFKINKNNKNKSKPDNLINYESNIKKRRITNCKDLFYIAEYEEMIMKENKNNE